MDSEKTSSLVVFASPLRDTGLLVEEAISAASPSMAHLFLLMLPVVLIPPTSILSSTSSSSHHSDWRTSSRAVSNNFFLRLSEMLGERELLPLLEVRDAGWAPVTATDVDAANFVEELVPVVLLVSRGAASGGERRSVVVWSGVTPIRIPRISDSSLPISKLLSPTSSTSWMLVGMHR